MLNKMIRSVRSALESSNAAIYHEGLRILIKNRIRTENEYAERGKANTNK